MTVKKQIFNPYLPLWEYIPDGEPRIFGDRLYVFGSHDRFNGEKYCLNNYVCWSTPVDDLSNWHCDGVIYEATQDPHNQDGQMQMFAPDVARGSDGRYYLYYALSFRNAVSVAVCSSPNGKYEFLDDVSYPDGTVLGEKQGDRFQFDPGVFIDDDGKVYLYTGFSPDRKLLSLIKQHMSESVTSEGSTVTELERDMKTVKRSPKPLIPGWENSDGTGFEGHEFFEASSIRKFGGTYYFVYSSILSHELCYATSKFPDQDFSYRGVLHSNGDIGIVRSAEEAKNFWGNNHGSIAHINDEYYIFGHRQTNTHEFSRQGVAEKLIEDGKGGFIQAEMSSCGLNGGPLTGRGKYSAGIACNLTVPAGTCKVTDASKEIHPYITQEASDYEPDSAATLPSQYIANMRNGALAGFKYFDLSDIKSIGITAKANTDGKMICDFFRKGESKVTATVTIAISATDDWQTFSSSVEVASGVYFLTFTVKGFGSIDFKAFTLE
jgi:hypothetical protein